MDTPSYEEETLFQLSKNVKSKRNALPSSSAIATDQNIQESIQSFETCNVLCVLRKQGKLGVAYYNLTTNLLYVYEEILDVAPQFLGFKSLYREVSPKFVLTFGSAKDSFVDTIIDTITNIDGNSTVSSDAARNLPKNCFLLSLKEYGYETCKAVLGQLTVASNAEETCEIKRELYLQSLICFDYKQSVHALGALVKYLDRNWAFFAQDKDELKVLHIYQITMKDHVLMDTVSMQALQVFQQRSHEASFKRGVQSNTREGLSVYRLFSTYCRSRLGQIHLKHILMNPLKNMEELNKRLEFIEFVLNPQNKEFVESIQEHIKKINDVNLILLEIQNSKAKARGWQTLYNSIFHSVLLHELSQPYGEKCVLLKDFHDSVTSSLIGLQKTIEKTLDFSIENRRSRPSIKFGLDENLDAKKLRKQDIVKHVDAASKVLVNDLPSFINECSVVYIPSHSGHLISIEEWEPGCDPEQLADLGFQYMFTLNGNLHYKNALCVEMDKSLGDINLEIISHENRIIQRLSGFVLKYNKDIRDPLKIIALIDCLIAMATVANDKNYVRPRLNNNRIHEIKDGRHPLMEMVSNYVPNDFYSGGSHSHIKFITGPNGSGKSIYLKQIGVIIFLAHIGSYVPAKFANIGLVHSIHLRMQVTESASVRLSAFMIDLAQATQALFEARASSLVILDEFGRGTTSDEGIALIEGALTKFINHGEDCPHVVLSTHFQEISQQIPASNLVLYQNMSHSRTEEGVITFLFKLREGVSASLAFDIATEVQFDTDIISRSREMYNALKNNLPLKAKWSKFNVSPETLNDFLSNVNIPELDEETNEEK